nr:PAS domain S-box protein [Actinomycetota bacterium]
YLEIESTSESLSRELPADLVSKTLHEVLPGEQAEAHLRYVRRALETGEVVEIEYSWEIAGREVCFEGIISPLQKDSVVWAARDITERKRTEQALRESEVKYRSLVEQLPAFIYVEAADEGKSEWNFLYISPQHEKLFGYPAEAWTTNNRFWEKLIHPDDRERVLLGHERATATGEPFSMEYRFVARDGRVVWVRDEAVLMRDGSGNPLLRQGIQTDITERKRAEEALSQSEELYRTVVEQAAESIFLVDAQTGRVLESNAALQSSLGYTAEELKEMTLYDIVAHDRESVERNIELVMREGGRSLGERRYRRREGTLAEVEVNVSAVPYDGRRVMCVVAHDVTERKRAERALEEIREAERNRIARELHDGTLQDIVYALQEIQILQTLSGDGGDPALEDSAAALRRSVEGLRGAIFELRLDGALGRSLVSSLENLVDLNRRMARGRYELELVVGTGFPSGVSGRVSQELTRIVQEALTNVRRHAEASHVRVELGAEGDLAYVEVSDDGRGFAPESSRIGVGRHSMQGRALEIGGELAIESEPGGGTRVRVGIPISRLV